jgi:hypothetical protein
VNASTYVAWCGPCNPAGFSRGIATNYGGTWHALTLPADFPNRFIQAVTVDRANPAHIYVVFNGFSDAGPTRSPPAKATSSSR